jgi:hypothetical protein
MAEGNAELKEKALAALRAGRRELDAEAGWLRHELSVKRIASDFTSEHIHTVLLVAFGVGVAVPWLVLNGRDKKHQKKDIKVQVKKPADETAVKTATGAYLGGVLIKMVTPLIMREGLRFLKSFSGYGGNGSKPQAETVSI